MIHISYYFFFYDDDFNDYYEKLKLENVTLVYVKAMPITNGGVYIVHASSALRA